MVGGASLRGSDPMELLIIMILLVAAIGGYLTGLAGALERRRKDISGRYVVNTTETVLVIPIWDNHTRRTAWSYAKDLVGDDLAKKNIKEALEDL
jgi:hypothetical protein